MAEIVGAGRFELVRRLGAGGTGVVYEALDRKRELRVALKQLTRLDAQSLYRFKSEFRALQDIDHPNLVRLDELVEDGRNWFMTMELIEGEEIVAYCRPGGRVDHDRVRRSFAQLTAAIDALHSSGKVHRDVKPANVLVDGAGRTVLLDFGLLFDPLATEVVEGSVVGTAAYMAPEQAASRTVGPAADWYGFGAVLYEALTGVQPFVGNLVEVLTEKQVREPLAVHERATETPPDLDALCAALLSFDPSARPDARSIIRALGVDAVPAGSSVPGPSSSLVGDELFVGRQTELAALAAQFEHARGGQMATAFVVGESGVGKSALLRRFTSELRDHEPTPLILRGRCYERESVHFKAFDGLIDALSRHLARMGEEDIWDILPNDSALLPQVFPVMGRVRGIARATRPLRGPRDPALLRTRVFAILREVFSNLAARREVVIAIDDFHWADADSQVLLDELMREPGAPPICLLVTSRDAANAPARAAVIDVGALPRGDAEELVRRLLEQTRVGGADARTIAVESGGHPLFIDEIVRHAALSGEPGMHLDDAIRARVSRIAPEAASLLRVISVAGVPLPAEVVRAVAQLDPGSMERATSQLRVARMIRSPRQGQLETYHDRVREAVIEAIDAGERRAMHGRLAAALETSDLARDRPEVMVRHLVAAGEQPAAAAYALRAAKRAADAFAFDRAADLYRLALDSGDHDAAERRALRIDLATVLAHAGRGRDAAPLYLAAASGADPATRVECQRLAARHLLQSGHFEQGIDALGEALAEQSLVLPKTPRRALRSLLWQRARLRLRGLRWRRRHRREIAESQLARVDVLLDVGEALGMFDSIRGADFQLRGLREALRLGEPTRVARGLCVEAIYAASQGGRSVARSRDLVIQLQSLVKEQGDPFLEALAVTAVGIVQLSGRRSDRRQRAPGRGRRPLQRPRLVVGAQQRAPVSLVHRPLDRRARPPGRASRDWHRRRPPPRRSVYGDRGPAHQQLAAARRGSTRRCRARPRRGVVASAHRRFSPAALVGARGAHRAGALSRRSGRARGRAGAAVSRPGQVAAPAHPVRARQLGLGLGAAVPGARRRSPGRGGACGAQAGRRAGRLRRGLVGAGARGAGVGGRSARRCRDAGRGGADRRPRGHAAARAHRRAAAGPAAREPVPRRRRRALAARAGRHRSGPAGGRAGARLHFAVSWAATP